MQSLYNGDSAPIGLQAGEWGLRGRGIPGRFATSNRVMREGLTEEKVYDKNLKEVKKWM